MQFRVRGMIALLLLTASASAMAQLREYRIDGDHSRILFRVDHLGLSGTLGTFSEIDGTIFFDDSRWDLSRLSVDIPLQSIDLGDDGWEAKVLDDYLQAEAHPLAHFESTAVVADGKSDGDHAGGNDGYAATISGLLTLNGVSRPVSLRVRHNGTVKSLYTKLKRKTGFSARTVIRRSDFGLNEQLDLVGDDIELELQIEGIEQRRR